MKTSFLGIFLVFSLLISACKKQEELPVPQAPESKSSAKENLATAPVNYLGAAGKAAQSMEKTVDAASLNNAVQLFGAQEGRFPKDLNELVTKRYIAKLPTPPFGTKLQYDANAGKVTVVKE